MLPLDKQRELADQLDRGTTEVVKKIEQIRNVML